ncbi:Dehydrogenase pkfF [Cladobotryum mycophilum]|uniref:Dehydrogenase pkfF n=1 Tax=Cladobotryum mycophilum TaxID=491253 RepID=A0ABR0T3M4_9HYPO
MSSSDITDTFDYIVVGGGTAGLVVASRLTEDPAVRLLVIEAGADHQNDPLVSTPGFLIGLLGNERYDWNYTSVPQAALDGRRASVARGKGLGGSSAINFMMTVFPSRASIDSWAKLGNQGWSYDELSPYFQRFGTRDSPTQEVREISRIKDFDDSLSGHGPVQMSFGQGHGALNSAWMDTHTALGFEAGKNDMMSGRVTGAFQNVSTIDPVTKARSYAAGAYYGPDVRQRSNLVVLTEATVHKIELEGVDPEVVATGVQLRMKDGSMRSMKANREVILAAGAINSPQILELSGIGRQELLEKHGIPVLVDLPEVGENLQDHVQEAVRQYQENGDGPLGSLAASASYLPMVDGDGSMSVDARKMMLDECGDESSGRTAVLKELLTIPDEPALSYVCFAAQMHTEGKEPSHFGTHMAPLRPENYITILNALAHPFSRGSCHIRSPNVNDAPLIDPAYMSHPVDMEIAARSVMFVEKLVSTEPWSSAVLAPGGARLPDIVPDHLEKAREVVRRRLVSNMHLSGTCAMLPRENGGVVSDRLLVHGTRNLRVIDASIFPLIPLGNIQTTVYAVAEKAADLIKGVV